MPTHILFGFLLDSSNFILKALVIVIPFLSFKGTIHAYLLKALITHHKNLNPLLNRLINCTFVKSAHQILYLNPE